MSDITKCTGEGCKMKNDCRRFTAKANEYWQAYFTEPPVKDGKCDMFWGHGQDQIMDQIIKIINGK